MPYAPPTAAEARAILANLGLSGSQAAELLGTNARSIRRYMGGDRTMAFPQLYTLLHRAAGRTAGPESWRSDVADMIGESD